jgi:hypothetical protein
LSPLSANRAIRSSYSDGRFRWKVGQIDDRLDYVLAGTRAEWSDDMRRVSPWEVERCLNTYRPPPAGDVGGAQRSDFGVIPGVSAGTHLEQAPNGSRRITGVRNFQAGAGIAVLRPLTHIHDPSATSFKPVQLTR